MSTGTVVHESTAKALLGLLRSAAEARTEHLVLLFPSGALPKLGRRGRFWAGVYLKRLGSVTIAVRGATGRGTPQAYLGQPVLPLRNVVEGYQFVLSLPERAVLAVFANRDLAGIEMAAARGGVDLLVQDRDLLERAGIPLGNEQFQFSVMPSAGAVLTGGKLTDHAVIPSKAAETGVIGVAPGAFENAEVSTLYAGENLRFIGADCFVGCRKLEDVLLPNGIQRIGEGAFANCPNLRSVRLPGSIRTIGEGAFSGSSQDLKLEVVAGSPAHAFAVQRGFSFDLMKPQSSDRGEDSGRLLTRGSVTYLTLPGGALQVVSVRGSAKIPGKVGKLPVVGIGTLALSRVGKKSSVSLPSSVRWVAANLFGNKGQAGSVAGLGEVPFGRLESGAGRLTQTFDFDRVLLTPRMLARILDVPVPDRLEPVADRPASAVANKLTEVERGSIFVALPRRPSRKLVERALAKGATVFVATRVAVDGTGEAHPTLLVEDPTQSGKDIGQWLSAQYSSKTIALTGSVGKTTTKEMIRRVAETEFDTTYNLGNKNVHTYVLPNIQKQTFQTQVYVQETGASFPGGVERMAQMLHPDAFVITNFGLNHVGDYGDDPDALLADKLSLDRYLPADGVAFVCYDDPKLREQKLTHRMVSYSVSDPLADYYAKDVVEAEGQLQFTVVEKETGLEVPVTVRALGRHNVANAVVAFAVGRWLEIPAQKIREGIYRYKGVGLRQNLTDVAGQQVLIDCYNASEVSARSVSQVLQTITPGPGGKRYLVFADIDDKLGEMTEDVHRRVGQGFASQERIDKVFLFGKHAGWAAEEMEAAGANHFHTTDRSELHRALAETVTPQDVIAFKGGQHMALAINIDDLFGSAFMLMDEVVVRARGTEFTSDGLTYTEMDEYGVVLLSVSKRLATRNLVIPGEVNGTPVRTVGRGAVSGHPFRSVEVSSPIRAIAEGAFAQCRNLETVRLPESLHYIGEGAFADCSKLTSIELPMGVTTIDAEAFARCTQLEYIVIPETVGTIGEDAFIGCENLTVQCVPGSSAEEYCEQSGIRTSPLVTEVE